jgi:hypothetical protein
MGNEWICTHEDVALPTFCLGGAEPLVFLLSGSISSSSNGFTAWIIAEGSIGCCACCWVICDMSGLDRVYEWDDCKFEGEYDREGCCCWYLLFDRNDVFDDFPDICTVSLIASAKSVGL